MHVCSVTKSSLTLCGMPDFSVRGISQIGILEGCHSLLQGIFPTQGLNPHLLLWQAGSLTEPLGKSLHIHNILFNLYVMDEAISRMFYGWENWTPKRLRTEPNVWWWVDARAGVRTLQPPFLIPLWPRLQDHVIGRWKGTVSGKTGKFTQNLWDLSHSGNLYILRNTNLLM